MIDTPKKNINKDRNELVVKRNEVIRNTRYDLSVTEQKIIIYLISKIEKEDNDLKTIQFKITDYCKIVGLSNGGRIYELVKDSIQGIRNKSWWINVDGKEKLFSWIDTATIDEKTGEVKVILSESLKPYLLNIKGNFTQYQLINILVLHSKYSIRLYEILKSYLWQHKWIVKVDEFRNILGIEDRYKDYTELKRNVIKPSIKEINKYTDLDIDFETEKKSKSIYKLIFHINETVGYQLVFDLIANRNERLD